MARARVVYWKRFEKGTLNAGNQTVTFEKGYPGINDLREEQMVRKILKKDPEQRTILDKILTF